MRDYDILSMLRENHKVMAICSRTINNIRDENVYIYRCLRNSIFYLALNGTIGAPAFMMLDKQFVDDLNDALLLTTIADMLLVPS